MKLSSNLNLNTYQNIKDKKISYSENSNFWEKGKKKLWNEFQEDI